MRRRRGCGELAGQKATRSERQMLRGKSVLRHYFSPLCVTPLTYSVPFKLDFSPKNVSKRMAQDDSGAKILGGLSNSDAGTCTTDFSQEQSTFLDPFLFFLFFF